MQKKVHEIDRNTESFKEKGSGNEKTAGESEVPSDQRRCSSGG